MSGRRIAPWVLGLACLAGCKTPVAGSDASAGDAGETTTSTAAPVDRAAALLSAEHRRMAQDVTAADQQSRDPAIRRAAARALGRIGGPAARPGLLRALDDEDAEVVAWAAYGLGFWCKGQERETVSALVARKVSLPPPAKGQGAPRLDPLAAIARAVGHCGAEESEPTLVAWLAGDREQAAAAAFALGDLATMRQKLREETLAALLNVAAGSAASPPVPEALFPVGRLDHVPLTVVDRIREVATLRLATAGDARLFAVRALGRAGEGAAAELGRVLSTPGSFSATERAEAARALGRLGKAGNKALAAALPGLVPSTDPVALTGLVGEDLGVLLATLDVVGAGDPAPFAMGETPRPLPQALRKPLTDLATLAPPAPGAPLPVLRRLALVRCGAARALAGANIHEKLLVECDVAPSGGAGQRALVEVIGRGDITGARLEALRERLRDGDLRAREAALELLEKHEEVEGAAALLTDALGASENGLVATAAEVLAKQPQRAVDDGGTVRAAPRKGKRRPRKKVDLEVVKALPAGPAPALVAALLAALKRPNAENDPESVDSLIDAAGALAVKDARPRLEELCRSPYPSTREHAAKALGLVGAEKKTCDAPADGGYAPFELDHLARSPVSLSLDTDAGALTLTLDPSLAPVAVTRIADLARSGYYDGLVVHRVVPGFVAQLGAPQGDGYGGPPGKPALRCETSPLPFVPLSVGVALAGRDTGSSQIFVTAGRYPHLDGQYALLGTAGGPWTSLAEGDVIRKITVHDGGDPQTPATGVGTASP